ncbi:MAG: cell division protein FtsA [Rhodobacterales bacterium]|nr:MAG: cell division protein FtsA [Rhodobacterales bacterium]
MSGLYQQQRAMRAMRSAALQRGTIAVLDIGTSKIGCLILRFDGAAMMREADGIGSLAGQSAFRVIGASNVLSRGVRHGEIDAMAETERAVRTAVQRAQKMANTRVDHVIATFSGANPRSYGLAGSVELEGPVREEDIARVMASCDAPDFGPGREVLHAQPVMFTIDHRTGLSDPRGQVGNTLSVDMHVLTVDASVIDNVVRCIKACDLEVAGLASSAYAAGISALVEDEQELGAASIDMGGGSTGLSVFMKKHMIFADAVRLGGDHVTQDISKGLHVPWATAERLKTFHGGVVATGLDDREQIEIGGNSGDWERDRRKVSRSELIGIIRPRVEEILDEVKGLLDAAGFDSLPSQQIVLTGGASQLPGLDGLAPRILGQQVRIGRPLRVQGLPADSARAAFSAAVGLCLFAAHPQDEWWDFDIPTERYSSRSLRWAMKWFRDNW